MQRHRQMAHCESGGNGGSTPPPPTPVTPRRVRRVAVGNENTRGSRDSSREECLFSLASENSREGGGNLLGEAVIFPAPEERGVPDGLNHPRMEISSHQNFPLGDLFPPPEYEHLPPAPPRVPLSESDQLFEHAQRQLAITGEVIECILEIGRIQIRMLELNDLTGMAFRRFLEATQRLSNHLINGTRIRRTEPQRQMHSTSSTSTSAAASSASQPPPPPTAECRSHAHGKASVKESGHYTEEKSESTSEHKSSSDGLKSDSGSSPFQNNRNNGSPKYGSLKKYNSF